MTRKIQFANNATSKLAANLGSGGTTATVTAGEGSKFPTLAAGQYFKATLINASGTKEVVKVTARAGDAFTITRAVESVGGVQTAYAFLAGDRIELRMTAASVADELDRLDAAALTHATNKTGNYTVLASDISTLIRVDSSGGARTVTLPDITTLTDDFDMIVAKITSDSNLVTIAGSGGNLINGASTYLLSLQWSCAWLIADRSTNTWTAINSGNSASNMVIDAFTGSGTSGPFTLSGDPVSKNNTAVFVGGVYQQKSTYTLAGTSLTLGGAVSSGVSVEVAWSAPLTIGVPSDGSVSTAKLADAGVTTAKLQDGAVTEPKLGDTVRAAIQKQTYTAFTTAGTAPSYTVTASPAVSVTAGTRLRLSIHASTTAGVSTLIANGGAIAAFKQYDSTGAKIDPVLAAGQLTDVEYDGTHWVVLDPLPNPNVLRSFISGFGMTWGATLITIAAGQCADSTNATYINLTSSLQKSRLPWAVGNTSGGLDTGTYSTNTWYYWYIIRRPDTGVVDAIFSLSPSAPTLPSGYTQYRYIGATYMNASVWEPFKQFGDYFQWSNPFLDWNAVGSTTASLLTCSVPSGRKMLAKFNIKVGATVTPAMVYLSDPDISDIAPSSTAAPLADVFSGSGASLNGNRTDCWTNTIGQIRHRSGDNSTFQLVTLGWMDLRGKNL